MYLSKFKCAILKIVSERPYISGNELKSSFSDHEIEFDTALSELIRDELLIYTPTSNEMDHILSLEVEKKCSVPFNMSYHLVLSPSGRSFLDFAQDSDRRMSVLESLADSDKKLAETAIEELAFTRQQAAEAKKDSKFAGFLAITSLLISAADLWFNHIIS